jgi:hypothetical protein
MNTQNVYNHKILCYYFNAIAVVKLVKTDNSQEKNLESGEDL